MLRKKGNGRSIHVSGFLTPGHGVLQHNGEHAQIVIHPGKNYDGRWDSDKIILQMEEKVFQIFEAEFPGCVGVFVFDHSSGHEAYAKDALRVSKMRVHPGGKVDVLRDGWFKDTDGNKVAQLMSIPMDDPDEAIRGKPKGMKRVLEERGLWKHGLVGKCFNCSSEERKVAASTDCCAQRILELRPDFQKQRCRIEEICEERGHTCVFLPKFHCELNFIEMY